MKHLSGGTLYLLPVLLGPESGIEYLCKHELELFQTLDLYFVENERSARRFLRKAGFKGDFEAVQLVPLDKDTKKETLREALKSVKEGRNAGCISEAGAPGIADPGSLIVQMAHEAFIPVKPIPGPSAIMLALMGSGMSGQHFVFHGYAPIDRSKRIQFIKELEANSSTNKSTQVFMETPYRNNQVLDDLLKTCKTSSRLCIAVNLLEPDGWIITQTVFNWSNHIPDLHKKPTVFCLSAI